MSDDDKIDFKNLYLRLHNCKQVTNLTNPRDHCFLQ